MLLLSTTLSKAFQTPAQGPFSTGPFASNFATEPLPDGFVHGGEKGGTTFKMISVIPYCDGPAGTLFSMRVFYWNNIGADASSRILVAIPLLEVLCVASNATGQFASSLFDANQHLCDNLTITAGSVGLEGSLYNPINGPGCDIPAMVQLEVQGARFVSFDFQNVDSNGQVINQGVNMNALWAKCE